MRAIAITMMVLASSASADEGADARTRIAGNVLVWHDAQLVFDPAQPKQTVQVATLKDGRRGSVGVVAPMRVIRVRGDLVEVEPSKDYQCTQSRLDVRALDEARVFVSRADLAPVVVKRFAKTFDDGTQIVLEPGMPVMPEGNGAYVAPLAREMLKVEVPAEHVGYSYAVAPRAQPDAPAVKPGTKQFRMYMDVTATLGGKPFTTRKDLFTPVAGAVETKGNVTLFPIEDRCGRAKVALPKDKIETYLEPEPVDGGTGGMIGALGGGAGEYLPAKTPMFAGKHRVGMLATERAPNKGTKCLDLYVAFDQPWLTGARSIGKSAKVPICAAPSTKLVKREGLGFGSLDQIAPVPALQDAKLTGNVLVSSEAKWYTDPTKGARFVELADPGQLTKKEVLDFVFAAKVIGVVGGLVEVELPRSTDCAPARVVTELGHVRLFVERTSLLPVLAKPYSKTFKNGSRIAIAPGVPLESSLDGYIVSIAGDRATVPIPGTSVAYSYTPVKVKAVPPDDGVKLRYSLTGAAMLGDHSMTTKQTSTRIVKRGNDVLFPIVAPCIEGLVLAPKDAVSSSKLGTGTKATGVMAERPIQERWYIPTGTSLLSATGRVVAKAAADIDVPRPAAGVTEVCHASELRVEPVTPIRSFAVRPPAARTLTLCVPIAQIKHTNPMPARP